MRLHKSKYKWKHKWKYKLISLLLAACLLSMEAGVCAEASEAAPQEQSEEILLRSISEETVAQSIAEEVALSEIPQHTTQNISKDTASQNISKDTASPNMSEDAVTHHMSEDAALQNISEKAASQTTSANEPTVSDKKVNAGADTSQADAPQADTPQADTPQADAPQADTPQTDTPQVDAPNKSDVSGNEHFEEIPVEDIIPPTEQVTYKVVFDANGGVVPADSGNVAKYTLTFEKNARLYFPYVPVRTGYIFTGWYLAGEEKVVTNPGNVQVTGDMSFHAEWIKAGMSIEIIDSDAPHEYLYTTGGVKPKVRVEFDGIELTEGRDYTLTYTNYNKIGNAGDGSKAPTVTAVGKGNFKGSIKTTYTIIPVEFLPALAVGPSYYMYTGSPIKYNYEVYKYIDGQAKKLSLGKDYVVERIEHYTGATTQWVPTDSVKDAGGYHILLKGSGSYNGGIIAYEFRVGSDSSLMQKSIKDTEFKWKDDVSKLRYDGEYHWADFTLKDKSTGRTLVYGVDYEANHSGGLYGTVNLDIIGIGTYTGVIRKSYTIQSLDLKAAYKKGLVEVTCSEAEQNKTGALPNVTVTAQIGDETVILRQGIDFKLTGRYNQVVSKSGGIAVIKGIGGYLNSITIPFRINAKSIDCQDVEVMATDILYTGVKGKYKTTIKLTDHGAKLKPGVDYASNISYTDAEGKPLTSKTIVHTGDRITVTIKGKGSYTGSVSTTYTVKEASIAKAITKVRTSKVYDGYSQYLEVGDIEVKIKKQTLKYGEDYVIRTYSNNVKSGTAMATIVGIGDYCGSKNIWFTIKPATLK